MSPLLTMKIYDFLFTSFSTRTIHFATVVLEELVKKYHPTVMLVHNKQTKAQG